MARFMEDLALVGLIQNQWLAGSRRQGAGQQK
jgi:hypothetical protein